MNTRSCILIVVLLFVFLPAGAQCAMCRAVLESGEGQEAARGINNGIIYLMAIPYILMGGLGYVLYRKFRNKKAI
ncbi:hypothetical protein [Sinomicrobium soli]|uniref:hypothetical protein n=1 Tax=Sinomicrobium sp. N-1-3-6 TaxID=2219864 RepID=UPI000DCB667D|nr:hypothetical protein [Sinomicrobium sp. N-1-3-6]RAV29687.1 hypothetical protein DN748_06100 [Sinomicrobium sp. N-1-3-6]